MFIFKKSEVVFHKKITNLDLQLYIFNLNIQLNFCTISSQRFKILTLTDNNPIHSNGSLRHEVCRNILYKILKKMRQTSVAP